MHPLLVERWRTKLRQGRRFGVRKRKARNRVPRPGRDAIDLASYLREHDIHTTGELRRKREETDPAVYDYVRCFGSWNEAVRQAHGDRPPENHPPSSAWNIIDTALKLNIATKDGWLRARRQSPATVCSFHQVRRHFGDWAGVRDELELRSADIVLGQYLELWNRLGHKPDWKDVAEHNLDLSVLRPVFKSKREVDAFLGILP